MKLIAYESADKKELYQMLKELPEKEWDFENSIYHANYDEFLKIYNKYLETLKMLNQYFYLMIYLVN